MADENKPKKGLAAMLIANAPRPDREDENEDEDGQNIAVEDLLTAIQENDILGFRIALNAFLDSRG